MPIGNLTSQIFANIYLNPLDQFVKHKLKIEYYLRYADDFVILHQDRNFLLERIPNIKTYLHEFLGLDLHPNKVFLSKFSGGIDFVGYLVLPHYAVVRTKTKRRIFRKVKQKIKGYKWGGVTDKSLQQTIHSYLGLLKHADSRKLERKLQYFIFDELGKENQNESL